MPPRRILFVEPFHGGSHRAFLDGLVRHSRHDVVTSTLPGGEWRARMRRGAQELAARIDEVVGTFDILIASDMLDLPVFLALTRARFERTPVMVYFHENQFTYPRIRGTKLNSWFGAINYLSARAADHVAFNSAYHRDDFHGALRTLAGEPNNWLVPGAIDEIAAKSLVLPVGVELADIREAFAAQESRPSLAAGDVRRPGAPSSPLILWNHRWEFDKAPDVFVRAVLALRAEGLGFRLALAGDPGLNPHPAMFELPKLLGDDVVQFGRVESRAAYVDLLLASDIVVSTTRHEFFGVGMVEALAAGCFPIVPARFTYLDLVPTELHARWLWETEEELVELLRSAILNHGRSAATPALHASAARFGWDVVAPIWDAALEVASVRGLNLPG